MPLGPRVDLTKSATDIAPTKEESLDISPFSSVELLDNTLGMVPPIASVFVVNIFDMIFLE
jgi:hypothetical protein